MMFCIDDIFSCFDKISACDIDVGRQTQEHSIYQVVMASAASCVLLLCYFALYVTTLFCVDPVKESGVFVFSGQKSWQEFCSLLWLHVD